MFKDLLNRQQFLSAEIAKCRNLIKASPSGKLEIYSNKTATRWYVKPDNGQRVYLPKDNYDMATLLAEKRIIEEKLSIYERELDAIETFLTKYPSDEERLSSEMMHTPFFKLAYPSALKSGNLSWQDEPFESNRAFPEKLIHPSPSGHMLRSKSECLIDMALANRKIPFRYECKLVLDYQTLYPDFTIYKQSTRQFKYWEHFGLMDDPRYRKKALEKEELYYSNGLFPGRDLIITYETMNSPLTTIDIEKVIDDIEDWLYS